MTVDPSRSHDSVRFRPFLLGACGVVAVVAGVCGFHVYSFLRASGPGVGLELRTSGASGLGVLCLVVLPVGALAVACYGVCDHVACRLAAARVRRGGCAHCGYSRSGAPGIECPECGRSTAVSPRRVWSDAGVRALAAASLAGSVVGGAGAEVLALADERAFAREAAAWEERGGTGVYARARAWPSTDCGLVYVPGRGISAHD